MGFRNIVRISVVTVLVLLMFAAFIAPIPVASESERIEAFSKVPILEGHSPNIGPFERECSFEYEGTKMKIVVSGETYIEQAELMVRYTQEFLTFDEDDSVLTSETSEMVDKLSDLVMLKDTLEDIIEPVKQAIPSSDWGTFTYYWWNGFKMIKAPGSTQRSVDYEHPDNYYYSLYHPEQWNLGWYYRAGGSRYMLTHHSQSEVNAAIDEASLWRVILFAVTAGFALFAGFIPAAAVLAVFAAAVISATLLVLGIYQFFLVWWLTVVLQAEQGDGFSYSYFWPDLWVSCSYGGWKDLWIRSYSLAGSV